MAKHIVAPATAEEMARTLGVTREDREIVERVLRELGEYARDPRDRDIEECATGSDPGGNPPPSGAPPRPPYKAPKKDE
jgi:hypothetical protein